MAATTTAGEVRAMTKNNRERKVITMNKLTAATVLVTLSLSLASCFESGSEETAPQPVAPPATGVAANGQTYYNSNCSTCHKAGAYDTTNAFNAADLAQKQDMIANNMSTYDQSSGFDLMTTFSNVSEQRVADLKAFLASIPAI